MDLDLICYKLLPMRLLFIAALLILAAQCACPNPPPAANFQIKKYEGVWYEIAKYQTAGGAYFEKDCTCTKIQVYQQSGAIYADQSCVKNGRVSDVKAILLPQDTPGKFVQKISFNRVGYWVIQLDDETAIEFDCGETAGIRNYCIHIMSKQKTLDAARLKQLSDYALSLGLNVNNLPMTITDQRNCINEPAELLKIQ